MFTRAVILPATALLVPGAAGVADPLAPVRLAACAALASLAEAGPPLVLAHGSGPARGPEAFRPSLAAAGIADVMLPGDVPAPWAAHRARTPAGTAASVALLCLGMALGEPAADVLALEVPAEPRRPGTDAPRSGTPGVVPDDPAPRAGAAVAAHLAAGGTLVVTSGGAPGPAAAAPRGPDGLAPGVAAVLAAAGADSWTRETRTFPQHHDHLPPEYRLTTCTVG
ncbi:hypothetical protein [Myceligenerans xiligouense]|uniref:hypothetical protein n=1 Tax=Myceligenerans xiligouense TaxID=253184 RepID=UPI000F4FFF94|nr:hypothetical protein [Myceligenerans xiligouense]